jgi:hypothetical protein
MAAFWRFIASVTKSPAPDALFDPSESVESFVLVGDCGLSGAVVGLRAGVTEGPLLILFLNAESCADKFDMFDAGCYGFACGLCGGARCSVGLTK